ncbi:MAG TPA: AI-2E family transporter [Acidimicrobiales bacterium]|nr:AI-2E family transporter [Acidimicrobiales bacterium]
MAERAHRHAAGQSEEPEPVDGPEGRPSNGPDVNSAEGEVEGYVEVEPAEARRSNAAALGTRVMERARRHEVPLDTILTAVGVVVATGIGLVLVWVLRRQILFIVVAGFIAILLTPAVHFLERHRLSRGWAATIVFLAGLFVFIFLVYLFGQPLVTSITHFVKEAPKLVNQAEHGKGAIGRLIRRFHLQKTVNQYAPKLQTLASHLATPALHFGSAAASTVLDVGTIAILSFFLLLEAPTLRGNVMSTLSPARAERVRRVSRQVSREVSGYMFGDIATSIIAGVVIFITLTILGVPFALLFGLWVAMVDLLPLIGGLLAGVPTVIVAAVHSLPAGIVTLIVFLVYQQIENHILNPLIMSKTVQLSPLWVLLSVLVFSTLGAKIGSTFGAFIGALIGIPVGGAVQVIGREVGRGPDPVEGGTGPPEGRPADAVS